MPETTDELDEKERRRALALLATVVFIAVTTGTMINVALPFIGAHFEVTEGVYSWIVTGYTLTFGIFSAIHGRLADVYGMRRLYIGGLCLFSATAVVVAFAPTIGLAIALRLLQGAGAAALPSLGSSIITRLFPSHRRGAAMGVIIGVVGLGASIGPFLGGLLLELTSWRAVFLFTALALFAVPLAIKQLPRSLDETSAQRFDVVGAALLGIGAAALMFSFNLLQNEGLGLEVGAVVGGAILSLGSFVLWIRRHDEPFIRPDLFRDSRFVACIVVAPLANATRFGTIVLVPILLVNVEHSSALEVGLVLFPGALAIALLSPRAGRWADRVGARRPVAIGVLAMSAGIVATSVTAGWSVVGVGVGMTLYGLGFAFIQSPLMSATSQILPSAHTGVGLGLFMMVLFLGGALGVAFTVTVVEMQGPGSSSWLGLPLGGGAPFSNAVLLLLGFVAVALPFVARVAGASPEPLTSAETTARGSDDAAETFNPFISSDY